MQQPGGTMRNSPPFASGGHSRHFDNILSPLVKTGTGASNRPYAFFSIFLFLLLGAFLSTRLLLDPSVLIEKETVSVTNSETTKFPIYPQPNKVITEKPRPKEFTLNCAAFSDNDTVKTCPRNNYPTSFRSGGGEDESERSPPPKCPDYFRWIHEDLRPWEKTGITREALERANATANFRLAIISGRIYVEKFREAFQTRDVFTIWGFVQLLRKYPGKIPDLEIMFDCVDWPVVREAEFTGIDHLTPPPLFRYCGNNETLDIVFPDWSYWGW